MPSCPSMSEGERQMKKREIPAPKIRSKADLEKIRTQVKPSLELEKGTRIVVGLGTCGMAAGAQLVYDTMEVEIKKLGLTDVSIEATGCVGICQFEPVVEVYQPGGSRTTYVRMTPERGIRVVQQHIRGGNALAEFAIGSAQNRR